MVRGPSGSAKTTTAEKLQPNPTYRVAADDSFMVGNVYRYQPKLIGWAHTMCRSATLQLLEAGIERVVVHNTFIHLWEMLDYRNMVKMVNKTAKTLDEKYEIRVVRCQGRFKNVHGVPDWKVQEMWDEIEDCPGEYLVCTLCHKVDCLGEQRCKYQH